MARFQVFVVWAVDDGKVARGGEVLHRGGVRGLRFSFYDGARLTVLADARADSPDDAVALVVGRVAIGWQTLAETPLGGPVHCEAMPTSGLRVPAGTRRGWRDAGRDAPRWVASDPTDEQPWPIADLDDTDDPDDPDDPDDGGLAGVREPRRPLPGPGHLFAAVPRG